MIKKKDVGLLQKQSPVQTQIVIFTKKGDEKDVQASEMMSALRRHHMPEEAPAEALCWFLGDLTGN